MAIPIRGVVERSKEIAQWAGSYILNSEQKTSPFFRAKWVRVPNITARWATVGTTREHVLVVFYM